MPVDSKVIGKTLPEISDPGKFLLMLIKKAGTNNYVIPSGSTVIEANDQLILIVNSENVKKLLASFGVK